MNDPRFRLAIEFARNHETTWPREIRSVIEGETFDPPPWNVVKGPIKDRGAPAGLIALRGKVAAAWGEVDRTDMIFSVTKSYIGLIAGLALDDGLIADFDDPVGAAVEHSAFAGPNAEVTWTQLLQQTSEWRGELWGIPDTVDRSRQLSPTEDQSRFATHTPHMAPGTYWDYNDIRVNALSLALTILYGRSLGNVLAERLITFDSNSDWNWQGYPPVSSVRIAGADVPVVVGGGHWGGGLVTSVTQDISLGLLIAGNGVLGGKRVLSDRALHHLLSPCPLQPVYGGLWWLNTDRQLYPQASAQSIFALGVGLNAIWIDPTADLVAVVHGIDEDSFPDFIKRVSAAIPSMP